MVGVLICIVTTIPAAYALSRDDLFGVKVLNLLFTFTMFFSGGIIPMFILLRTIKIYNSIWAIVFPSAVSVFNLIVCKTFFMTNIPRELHDAAVVDSCPISAFSSRSCFPFRQRLSLSWYCSMVPDFGMTT